MRQWPTLVPSIQLILPFHALERFAGALSAIAPASPDNPLGAFFVDGHIANV